MERYLLNFLKHSDNALQNKYVDLFKVELDWFIYNYGDHIASTHNRTAKKNIRKRLVNLFQQYGPIRMHQRVTGGANILSSVAFRDDIIPRIGYNAYSSILQPIGRENIIRDANTIRLLRRIKKAINHGVFSDLFNLHLFQELEDNQARIKKQYENYDFKGLFLFTDEYFESKYLIDIFRQLNRPSFIFSHGLPGIYSKDVDNRTDYLMVWGERIKENYVKLAGFNPDKIYVVGNSRYVDISRPLKLRNSLDNILVIPTSSLLWHQHTWDDPTLVDRSMVILYLYQVQHVLQKLGVNHARVRPHPAINKDWVYGFLDKSFYTLDTDTFANSCAKSSLVIGATSTTFLEALMAGVNYIIYEPLDSDQKGLLRSKRVPPFDGSGTSLEIANDMDQLEHLLKSRYQSSPRILDGYIQPLDLTVIKSILK